MSYRNSFRTYAKNKSAAHYPRDRARAGIMARALIAAWLANRMHSRDTKQASN